jgi:hypothetical protein
MMRPMVTARDASRTSTIPRTGDGSKRRGAQGTSKRTPAIAARRSQYAGPDGDDKGRASLVGRGSFPLRRPQGDGKPGRRSRGGAGDGVGDAGDRVGAPVFRSEVTVSSGSSCTPAVAALLNCPTRASTQISRGAAVAADRISGISYHNCVNETTSPGSRTGLGQEIAASPSSDLTSAKKSGSGRTR